MRYGSVCSGIEAATIAWEQLGWQAAFYSEIDPFPCHVLHEHYSSGRPQFMPDPDQPGLKPKDRKARAAAIKAVSRLPERANGVPNHGDMTQFDRWPDHAVDLLVGGTPCQDYSIAGLRAGMDGVRGSLTLTYAAIARRYRPRWLVWENVFGVLSSKGGRDFASLLGLLSGRRVEVPAGGWKSAGIVEGYSGAYGLAWRVLDTQYVRVDGAPRALPQRRRRVFVVGCFGGDWRRAAAVLFERESLSGNPAPRREPGKRVAPTIASRPTGGGGLGTDFELDGGLTAVSDVVGCMPHQAHGGVDTQTALSGYQIPARQAFGGNNCSASLAAHAGPAGRIDFASETFVVSGHGDYRHGLPTLRAEGGDAAGGSEALVAQPVSGNLGQRTTDHPNGMKSESDFLVAHSLRPEGWDASEDGTGRGTPIVPVAYSIMPQNSGKDYKARQVEVAQPVMAGGPVGGNQGGDYILDPVDYPIVVKGKQTLHNAGVRQEVIADASAQKTHSGEILRRVREALGEEAFAEWGLGILDPFQPSEILRSEVHGGEFRQAPSFEVEVVRRAQTRSADCAGWTLREVRSAGRARRTPSRLELSEQCARELGAYLSSLPQSGAPSAELLQDLWETSQGVGILREALSALQEIWRPAADQGEPAHTHWAVRRLTPTEAARLQGFPDNHCRIPWRGKPAEQCPDGPQYKAYGNSMSTNVMRWLGERIEMVDAIGTESAAA